MEQLTFKAQMEAILFAAGEPVAVEKLAKFLGQSEDEVVKELVELEECYKTQSGLQLIFKDKSVQLVSRKEVGELIAKFLNKELGEELSNAAAEVLAVVAYRGPVTRAQIEEIRGVNCSFTLRNLAIRGLVERKDNPTDSRSYLYDLSFDLLKHLGLSKKEELPDFDELSKPITAPTTEIPNQSNTAEKEAA